MIEVFLFILKYKITKDKESLPLRCREFFKLSNKNRKKVLDKYFKHLDNNFNIDYYFNNKNARYYNNGEEISFFNSYYFCKKIIDLNVHNLFLIDKFNISDEKINNLINYSLEIIKENNINLDIEKLLVYPSNLPQHLSENIDFMKYITTNNIYNIKYITYNDKYPEAQRELITKIIEKSKKEPFNLSNFLLNNKELPKLLSTNIDFIIYIIENDIKNIKYLDEKTLNSKTITEKHRITKAIINYLNNNDESIKIIEDNITLATYLNKDYEFVNYIINKDVNNIIYVDWHNIPSNDIKKIIDSLALKLVKENIDFDYTKYPFKNILKQNYMFMAYLIDKDKRNIKEIMVTNKDEINKLIDIYLNKYRKCKFNIEEYLDDNGYINNYLVENKYMLSYLIKNDNKVFKYIDFLNLNNSKEVVEVILKAMDKNNFEFDNESFLRNGKYPIPLSNNYRFMRYVIDKNFNNLAYIDISMIDNKELKRIINYAFRMVYYIRGNNKNLNFDLDGYFKNSSIVSNEYFQECLKSL